MTPTTYYVLHCHTVARGNYRHIVRGTNRSTAISAHPIASRDYAANGVCISECSSLIEAQAIRPRIR